MEERIRLENCCRGFNEEHACDFFLNWSQHFRRNCCLKFYFYFSSGSHFWRSGTIRVIKKNFLWLFHG